MPFTRRRWRSRLDIESLEGRTLLSYSSPAALHAANDPEQSLVVRFVDGTSEATKQRALGTLGVIVETFDSGSSLVALNPGVNPDQARRLLQANPATRFAVPNA